MEEKAALTQIWRLKPNDIFYFPLNPSKNKFLKALPLNAKVTRFWYKDLDRKQNYYTTVKMTKVIKIIE